jgi:hypothetical protein
MIHLPTAAGGRVEHVVRVGDVVRAGVLLARVHPASGPVEEMIAPFDAVVAVQRLRRKEAPPYTPLIGLRRVVLATCPGRLRWIATLGPVSVTTLVALVDHEGAVRPHRAGAIGFVGEHFFTPGAVVEPGQPLVEIRGEEME